MSSTNKKVCLHNVVFAAALLAIPSLSLASSPPSITNLACAPFGVFTAECEVSYQSASAVQIRWTWNGFPLTVWNDSPWAISGCSVYGPPTPVSVEVINAFGSDSENTMIYNCPGGQ